MPRESLMRAGVRANIRASVDAIRRGTTLLEGMVTSGQLLVVGAEYDLVTGQVELPSMGQKLAVPVQPLEVTVGRNGQYSLRDMTSSTSPVRVGPEELVARIKEAQARHAGQPVVIAADKRVQYDEVIKVLETLQSNGIQKVGLLVRQPG